ncbi:hypothetical protein [Romboutsia sp. Marseille-P6047]|uniref:hypothetical protein n=1 Tax=Romboutsia sp. Marseille-P6047 TaxID=2161817 RepID=UPI000F057D1F|nr:hypothetical protein [Romboutsia sp. Marseille-P6047]
MKKKIASLLMAIMILVSFMPINSYANGSNNKVQGKVIFINMNRTSLASMLQISSLKEELDNRGYIGLMNIRGDKGTDDRRSLATMGAGRRANVSTESFINFRESNDNSSKVYEASTNAKAKSINDLTINRSLNENAENGEYGAVLGSLGQTLSENNLKTALIGNSDTIENENLVRNRNLGLVAMDQYGRIDAGNIDNINIEDLSMPYGIRTDYNKLLEETKNQYKESDAIFVDIGDTYRLDKYRLNLNEATYSATKSKILNYIDEYLKEVFSIVNENDTIYIVSAFPSDIDYSNRRRLSPIIKLSNEGKGLLASATTRRDGIVANLDIGVDILNEFGLENEDMVGKSFTTIDKDDNTTYLLDEYEKIVSISNIRSTIINTFVGVVSVSWVIAMFAVLFRNYIPNKEKVFKVLKEFIKLGFILPLAFLVVGIFNFKTQVSISLGITGTTILLYILGRILFKDDIKHMGFFAGITILAISMDCVFGTYLMKNSIMSYDAIIGARYYGMGNEYQGIAIGSAIFALAVLLQYRKIPKWLAAVASVLTLLTTASPSMGANVGAAISECVAYLVFLLIIFDVKLDFKKVFLILLAAAGVVFAFAAFDIISGSESHLSGFVKQILANGPITIIQTFSRKIQMNLKLAKTTVWVNILLVGVAIVGIMIFRPSKHFRNLANKYKYIFDSFIATLVGCFITLLVNDSGIVAAATACIYILIPLIIISINMIIFEDEK